MTNFEMLLIVKVGVLIIHFALKIDTSVPKNTAAVNRNHPTNDSEKALRYFHRLASPNTKIFSESVEEFFNHTNQLSFVLPRTNSIMQSEIINNLGSRSQDDKMQLKKQSLIFLEILLQNYYSASHQSIQKNIESIEILDQDIADKLVEVENKMILQNSLDTVRLIQKTKQQNSHK